MARRKDIQRFKASLANESPPEGLKPPLLALWHLSRGDWDRAHRIAQAIPGPDGAWVHAHLHRVEGDGANAAYWYGRAGRPVHRGAFEDEWNQIAAALLESD